MAANLDRAETSLTAVSDIAYIRGIDSSGNSVRISKADLASVLGGQINEIRVTNLGYGSDFNNCTVKAKHISFYVVPSGAANKPEESWVDGYVIAFGWTNDMYFTQFALGKTGLYYRNHSKSSGFDESWIKL